ncbi:Poly-beta-1,6-N-acetyl-D-glucosamine N-deacetylase precursor [Jeotgalicoccus saudimassiliensis]|uniref:Poly-beta-1,6-N-acetyl-D-glucosamine N-deacetylase n=1 Tax=Jeotgalicoccus saudimassiliensis TaxID=1461582 RepID=A0A078M2J9_9STAP|nr:polysaccharide deacetylase family protein [Jeotgalicoccus saudimassiliensis]CEA00464.1 Poly-beta-1,6-N-acetyl-D-glucosamine N-deacetylase precursor [Jeotgalicoccus saudimassiliensis]
MKKHIKKILIFISSITAIKKNNSMIYYHEVTNGPGYSFQKINFEIFKDQMKYLKDMGYKTVLLNELEKENYNDKEVCIMFDDGYKDNYEIVYPFMKEMNMKFNIFLETNAVTNDDAYISWTNVDEMYKSNLVDFGMHTHTHIDARFINESNYQEEILYPNSLYEKYLDKKPVDFCFPFGAYNKKAINYFLNYTPYIRLFRSDGNLKKMKNKKLVMGRVGIENEDSLSVFRRKLNGGYDNYLYLNYLFKRILKRSEKNEYRKYS